jgi:large conductance mechanosensitive channel
MSIATEFKAFALKGNVVDLAVGVIIGAAFGKIVTSLVNDIIMPVVGAVFGNVDFTQLFVALGQVPAGVPMVLADLQKAGVPVLAYGSFVTVTINFLILAFIIFIMVRQINRLKRQEQASPAAPAVTPEDIALLREIRDSLKK